MPWRTSSWPTGPVTTTSVTCSPALPSWLPGTPQRTPRWQARPARQASRWDTGPEATATVALRMQIKFWTSYLGMRRNIIEKLLVGVSRNSSLGQIIEARLKAAERRRREIMPESLAKYVTLWRSDLE